MPEHNNAAPRSRQCGSRACSGRAAGILRGADRGVGSRLRAALRQQEFHLAGFGAGLLQQRGRAVRSCVACGNTRRRPVQYRAGQRREAVTRRCLRRRTQRHQPGARRRGKHRKQPVPAQAGGTQNRSSRCVFAVGTRVCRSRARPVGTPLHLLRQDSFAPSDRNQPPRCREPHPLRRAQLPAFPQGVPLTRSAGYRALLAGLVGQPCWTGPQSPPYKQR